MISSLRLWASPNKFFVVDSRKMANGGTVVPVRLDQRAWVNPFESLSRPRIQMTTWL